MSDEVEKQLQEQEQTHLSLPLHPFQAEDSEKSTRVPQDGRTALEKAQEVKKTNNLEVPKERKLEELGASLEIGYTNAQELEDTVSYSKPARIRIPTKEAASSLYKAGEGEMTLDLRELVVFKGTSQTCPGGEAGLPWEQDGTGWLLFD